MAAAADEKDVSIGQFREYLSILARLQVEPRMQSKVDLSGVVQQTMLEAHQDQDRLRGQSDGQRVAWLRRILLNNLADELRKQHAAKRDVNLVRSLDVALEDSASRLEQWLVADQPSPSQQAIRQEQLLALADAISTLPENQRRAVELHHLKGHTLAQIADELGTTKPAVAGLLHRGVERLRERLDAAHGE